MEAIDNRIPALVKSTLLYRVSASVDCEGRNKPITLGWFVDCDVATKEAEGKGPMGSNADVDHRIMWTVSYMTPDGQRMLAILGDRVNTDTIADDVIRAHAIAKLTARELVVLGLNSASSGLVGVR